MPENEGEVRAQYLRRLRPRFYTLALLLLALVLLALAWAFTPLREMLDVGRTVGYLRAQGAAIGPVLGLVGFVLASMLAVPLTFLTLVTVVAYEPWQAYWCCVLGACIGGALSHQLGAFLGAEFVRRLASESVARVSQRLGDRGLLAVIVIRLLPVASFAIVNMLIGASHIRLHHLLLGTLIGISPGVLVMIFFVDRITAWFGA